MFLFQISIVFMIFSISFVHSLVNGIDSMNYTVKVSPGLYLRTPDHPPVIYSQHTKLFFDYSISLLPRSNYLSSHVPKFCNTNSESETSKLKTVQCYIFEEITRNLNYTESTLDLLYQQITDDEGYHAYEYTVEVASPSSSIPSSSQQQQVSVTSSSVAATTPNPVNNNQIAPGRRKRQIILGALAATGAYKLYEYFTGGDPTSATVVNSMVSGMKYLQSGILQDSKRLDAFEHELNNNMHQVVTKFNALLATEKSNAAKHYQSLVGGEIRQALSTAHSVQELTRLVDLVTYFAIMSDCRQRRIPAHIIAPEELKAQLIALDKQLRKRDHTLVIPAEDKSTYYHLPIATCRMGPFQTTIKIHVILDIPIKRLDHEMSLYQAIAIPFTSKGQLCRLDVNHHTVIKRNDKVFVIDGSQAHSCDFDKELCYFS